MVGNEPALKALERSASSSLLSNTSVVILNAEGGFSMCGAAIRYRPNGEYPYCAACSQISAYHKVTHDGKAVIFRCRVDDHPMTAARCQVVPLLESDEIRTVVGGVKAHCRYIVTK